MTKATQFMLIKNETTKLVVITRRDMSPGYQMVQSNHATADIVYHLAFNNPTLLHEWKEKSNSIITLSVKDVEELNLIHNKFKDKVTIEKFYEPDVTEFTSMAFIMDDSIRRKLSYLPLSLKNATENNNKQINKN